MEKNKSEDKKSICRLTVVVDVLIILKLCNIECGYRGMN
jgi:hypothetical protein